MFKVNLLNASNIVMANMSTSGIIRFLIDKTIVSTNEVSYIRNAISDP